MSLKGDMKKLVRSATKRGWRDVTCEKKRNSVHYVLEWTDGTKVYVSCTPSCHHAIKNCAADLRRVEKQLDTDDK
jgi:hypothetical protein